ncbi:DUF3040 domain-containing protein [Streptomyces sp. NRRL S-340]|uniref:DUF3040 domain-containing protein n=1 Tax=Streptomyces sp. NRRL S-340 TaxID=1463901 RepID=UPI0005682A76|nr:DUF3040 domain-containing protein [Streptomyces sp. NRRL S-340]
MNVDRELARIEKQLVAQDPLLASKLETFEQITAPRPRAPGRRHVYLLAAVVMTLLALTTALAAGTADEHPRPPQVVREHPQGRG